MLTHHEIRDNLALFLTRYRQCIEFSQRSEGIKYLEDAICSLDTLVKDTTTLKTQVEEISSKLQDTQQSNTELKAKLDAFEEIVTGNLDQCMKYISKMTNDNIRERIIEKIRNITSNLN